MSLQYWDYFLSIESDLEKCSRYVEFTKSNYKAYSIEFARIIMAASAEIDTVAKSLCENINHNGKVGNILEYGSVILVKYPKIAKAKTVINRYNISLTPWSKWTIKTSPTWWQQYNNIKHDRTQYFFNANMINAISTVSGLLVLLLYYYVNKNNGVMEDIDSFSSPKIINIVTPPKYSGMMGGGILWRYIIDL